MKIGLQLYTMRDFIRSAEGLDEVLAHAAKLGYEGVQLSAVGCMEGEKPEVNAPRARAMLDRHGLVCCATHRPWERLAEHLDEEVAFHRALGCDYVAIGTAPKTAYEGGLAGFEQLAREVGPVIDGLGSAGIRFGYHNHAIEFERFPPKGVRPMDILLKDAPAGLMIELDTYWVSHAGVEVAPFIDQLKRRLPMVHVKDKGVFGWEVDYAPVGEGNLNWDVILPAFESAGTEWLLVEQDSCRRDVLDSVRSSLEFLRSML